LGCSEIPWDKINYGNSLLLETNVIQIEIPQYWQKCHCRSCDDWGQFYKGR